MMKRLFDVLVSAVGLTILAPLLGVVATVVGLTSPGGVFYRGVRVGRFGRPFRIFKFRSMVPDAEYNGSVCVTDDDARLTWIGRWLRKTKIDELPQLINVLRGEMSIVGPRPELREHVALYSRDAYQVLELRPGITDWASIVYSDLVQYFNESDDPEAMYRRHVIPMKLRLQLWYSTNQSLWMDLKIIAYTLRKVVRRDGWIPPEVRAIVQHEYSSVAQQHTVT